MASRRRQGAGHAVARARLRGARSRSRPGRRKPGARRRAVVQGYHRRLPAHALSQSDV